MSEQTVYIICYDDIVRDRINHLLESVGLKTQQFVNTLDFVGQYSDSLSGCIITGIKMAGLSGLALQKELNSMGSMLPVIFITDHADISVISEAFRNGAFDVIGSPYNEQNLLDRINAALQEDREIRLASCKKETFRKKAESLTNREYEVLKLVADGMTNKIIARELSISPRTVEAHRQRALLKIGIRSINDIKKYI